MPGSVYAFTWVATRLVGFSKTEVVTVDTGEVQVTRGGWRDARQCALLGKQPETMLVKHLPSLSKLWRFTKKSLPTLWEQVIMKREL